MFKPIPTACLMLLLVVAVDIAGASAVGTTKAVTSDDFVMIKGGCFSQGSPSEEPLRHADEGPQKSVCVDDFNLGRYEVTNAQFRLYRPGHDSGSHEGKSLNEDTQPAVFISWNDAVAYAKWLSERTGKAYRLPTEAEWEYAARSGQAAAQFWGEDSAQACAYANLGDQTAKANWQNWAQWPVFECTDGFTVSSPVGSFTANTYGLYDMLGNVWEWTADPYVENASVDGGTSVPKAGAARSLRGGSWYSGPENARAARRSWCRSDSKVNSLGFRLALSVN